MRMWVGTSGYSYREWKGSFYPADLPNGEMLRHYGSRLPAVEINNTFYRLPKESVLAGWAQQVPADFRFVLKASRRITHFKRLKGAEDETGYLLRTAGALGDRLGVVLFQLPPNLKKDAERLSDFLDGLGAPERATFEFRHDSWFDGEIYDLLQGKGAALCFADTDEASDDALERFVSTAPWGYLRLRRATYDGPALEAWAERISGQAWEHAYVFFKHEDGGAGPEMAERFLALAGAG
ncbi:MAG: DUF72 domain-containing protein [Gemmatimonadota bacterium]